MLWDVLLDTTLDALKLLPFLFLAYLAIEIIEDRAEEKTVAMIHAAGAWGPVIGAGLGVIPQCGFSAAVSNLYAGGLITRSDAAMAYVSQFDHVMPIWGVQRMRELEEFLSYMDNPPTLTDDMRALIEADRQELSGDFCRGCGYCMPCPAGIEINNCARMIQLIRRSPSARWLEPDQQAKMEKIAGCLHCGKCMRHCPYGLHIPELLAKNLEDYRRIVSGEITV